MDKPKIVCLCGSTKFREAFEEANKSFTLNGFIVLTVGFFDHSDGIEIPSSMKLKLDELHKRKIDLADLVYIIDVNNYIGESTRSEIEYATQCCKEIRYLSEDQKGKLMPTKIQWADEIPKP